MADTTVRTSPELDADLVEAALDAARAGDVARVEALLDPVHPADVADLLEQVSETDREALLAMGSAVIDGEVLSEISDAIRDDVLDALPDHLVADALRELDSDDLVDIVEDLEAEDQGRLLGAMDAADRVAVEQALAWPEHSAGRLMQRETVVAPEHWTVGEAIDFLRKSSHLPDQFYHVILVDPRMNPVGYVTLGRVLSAGRDVALREITEDSFRMVKATDEEADVAY
ncbi:MAG: CBS domain-containing protein, partial [Gemmatimonadales bacterium]|nr:CBS domain-containing protein [Gemmatimonadales bacterium]